ncbi:hypothetical protein M419DRAFT_89683 [Trichoderma reesei RUT C-30]|nr:hypothetical protein M419DRAFT_89683 [Trichoderma reesei RUT C-30]
MATTTMQHNPVFEVLAIIQAGLDKFPNPSDNLDFTQCRGLVNKSTNQCENKSCKKSEREKVKSLFSDFKRMAECPDSDGFYEDMQFFVTYTHCSKHRKDVCTAFERWKNLRSAAAYTPRFMIPGAYPDDSRPPSPADSPAESLAASSDAIFSPALSQSSNEMFHFASSDALVCDEPDSYSASEDGEDPLMTDIISKMAATKIDSPGRMDVTVRRKSKECEGLKIHGLGIGKPKRALSLTDHTPVLRVFYEHPSKTAMKEGTIYVLKHLLAPGYFKIGTTIRGAGVRVDEQCFKNSSKMIYESRVKFRGAQKAEKIIHKELHNHQILVKQCEGCGGGHTEVFNAPEDKIRETIEKIERVVQLPAYIQQEGKWKLSQEAKLLLHDIYGPRARHWREVMGANTGYGRAQNESREATRQEPSSQGRTAIAIAAEAQGTDPMPFEIRFEARASVPDDLEVNFRVRRGEAPANADEAEVLILPRRPKPEEAGGGILGRGFRALIGGFSRGGSIE